MDKTMAGLLGAMGALAATAPAHAANAVPGGAARQSADILRPASYADLLRPIPNAVEVLKAADAAEAAATPAPEAADPNVMQVQYYYHHHHHHHHHRYIRRYHHHHHHHHHHVIGRVLNDILR
jgi:hypothetical protein